MFEKKKQQNKIKIVRPCQEFHKDFCNDTNENDEKKNTNKLNCFICDSRQNQFCLKKKKKVFQGFIFFQKLKTSKDRNSNAECEETQLTVPQSLAEGIP